MKKKYSAPVAEKITFHYKEQVTASTGGEKECYWAGTTVRSYPGCADVHTGAMNN